MIGLKSPKRDNWNIIKLAEEGGPKVLARLRGGEGDGRPLGGCSCLGICVFQFQPPGERDEPQGG